jgi:hypothetical protein
VARGQLEQQNRAEETRRNAALQMLQVAKQTGATPEAKPEEE